MSDRMALLERVAEAARQTHVTQTPAGLAAAIVLRAALDALDALPAEPVGETVEVGVWRDEGGNVALFIAGTQLDQTTADHWTRVGTATIPTVAARVEG